MERIPDLRIDDLLERHPATSRVFRRHAIDVRGAGGTVAAACAERGLDERRVVEELRCAVEHGVADSEPADGTPDWRREDLASVLRFIVERYHVPLREELERLRLASRTVVSVHGEGAPELWPRLDAALQRLQAGVCAQMENEESVLFPLIERLCELARRGERADLGASPAIAPAIVSMAGSHQRLGADLRAIRTLTRGFAAAPDACHAVCALLAGLEHFEDELLHHARREHEFLFPRALDLERALAARRQTP